ncbi:putative quinol monooxygenase [Arcobacter sp.]|uniref:putative quinol monooxygenase n=1 Tax=Arcobacter sp. TaxID=1872629 RepID=UPI003D0986F4
MKTTLFIFATLHPKKESFDKAKEILKLIIDDTRKESGCIEFNLYEDLESNKLYLYEQWSDELSLNNHFTYHYTLKALEDIKNHLEKQTDVIKMEKIK